MVLNFADPERREAVQRRREGPEGQVGRGEEEGAQVIEAEADGRNEGQPDGPVRRPPQRVGQQDQENKGGKLAGTLSLSLVWREKPSSNLFLV